MQLEQMLRRIEKCPSLYLGSDDIFALSQYLMGYCQAMGEEDPGFGDWLNKDFRKYLASLYRDDRSIRWAQMIAEHEPDGHSTDAFFRLLGKYRQGDGLPEVRRLDSRSLWEADKLSAQGDPEFVSMYEHSFVEAYRAYAAGGQAVPLGIYDQGEMVGFAMLLCCSSRGYDDLPFSADNYVIDRYMIARQYEARSLNKPALYALIQYIRKFPCGKAKYCRISWAEEDCAAHEMYRSLGFRALQASFDGKKIAVLEL